MEDLPKSNGWLEARPDSDSVESVLVTYVLLETLFSESFLSEARSWSSTIAKSRTAREGLLQGFKLLVVAILDKYVDGIVRTPEVLGVTPDPDYRDYWAFTKGRGRLITKTSPRPGHALSKFIARANLLVDGVLKVKNWKDAEVFADEIKAFAGCLCVISEGAYLVSRRKKKVAMYKALRVCAYYELWAACSGRLLVSHKYTDYFLNSDERLDRKLPFMEL